MRTLSIEELTLVSGGTVECKDDYKDPCKDEKDKCKELPRGLKKKDCLPPGWAKKEICKDDCSAG
jgi:hypothetical protein